MRPAAVLDRNGANFDLDRPAVLAQRLELGAATLAREAASHELAAALGIRGRHLHLVIAPQHLPARIAIDALVGGVYVDAPEVGIPQHQRILGSVEDRPVLLLARAQQLLLALARGDVAADVEDVRLALVQDRHAARLDVEAAAILAPRERLEHHTLAGERS